MDTSETYIKMCEKAVEIQDTWEIAAWDYCYCEKEARVVVLSGYETDAGYYGHGIESYSFRDEIEIIGTWSENRGCGGEGKHIFLPRQDQLQEMVLESNHPDELLKIIGHFHDFACGVTPQFDSMEQLWLAFVMKERYSKIWNGEEWQ